MQGLVKVYGMIGGDEVYSLRRIGAAAICFLVVAGWFGGSLARGAARMWNGGVVVSTEDPEYNEQGTWRTEENPRFTSRGLNYLKPRITEEIGAVAEFSAALTPGIYQVSVYRLPGSTVEISVDSTTGTKTFKQNMDAGYDGWYPLGDFKFGGEAEVRFKLLEGSLMRVSGVKFVPKDKVRKAALDPKPEPDGSIARLDFAGNAPQILVSGEPVLLRGCEVENRATDSSDDVPYIGALLDALAANNINLVETPISWKSFEPREGEFDYRVIDALIDQARQRNMYLSILWFGTFKNLQSNYAPKWLKNKEGVFSRIREGGEPFNAISEFSKTALEADKRAFETLMKRIGARDTDHNTVILVQVENEMPSKRDCSAAGLKAYNSQVPSKLIEYLVNNDGKLQPWLQDAWNAQGKPRTGTWPEVFDARCAGRFFGAWFVGQYANAVAQAGKKILALPMYINNWSGESPGWYRWMDVCHIAAPDIDMIGNDSYATDGAYAYRSVFHKRSWNPIIVPETNPGAYSGNRNLWAICAQDALFTAAYWAERQWGNERQVYGLLRQMDEQVLKLRGTGRMTAFYQHKAYPGWYDRTSYLGYRVTFRATDSFKISDKEDIAYSGETPGVAVLMQAENGDLIAIGSRCTVEIQPRFGGELNVARAESGHFSDNRWISDGPATLDSSDGFVSIRFNRQPGIYEQYRFHLTPQPPRTIRLEAEDASEKTGDVQRITDGAASAGEAVASLNRPGDRCRWSEVPKASQLLIRYATVQPGTISVYSERNLIAKPQLVPTAGLTGEFNYRDVLVDHPVGSTLSVQLDDGDVPCTIDFIELDLGEPGPGIKNRGPVGQLNWLEAEATANQRDFSPLQVATDDRTRVKYVVVPEKTLQGDLSEVDAQRGLMKFDFEMFGSVAIWLRVHAPNAGSDSYFLKVDDGKYAEWNNISTSGWQWVRWKNVMLAPDKRRHTLYIATREDGVELDKVLIANDLEYVPHGVGGEPPTSTQ